MSAAISIDVSEGQSITTTRASAEVHAKSHAGAIPWHYTQKELRADLMVHITGLCLGPVAAILLIRLAVMSCPTLEVLAVSIYIAALISMLTLSAAYNAWPLGATKWMLRRFDHSAIYVLIAATYTPFLVEARDRAIALAVLAGVWCIAAVGIVIKLVLPGRFDRLSIGVCLAMGWSVIALCHDPAIIPMATHRLILLGGALYSIGVLFHVWTKLRFQNAIWHCFVLIGAACHYGAIARLVMS